MHTFIDLADYDCAHDRYGDIGIVIYAHSKHGSFWMVPAPEYPPADIGAKIDAIRSVLQ